MRALVRDGVVRDGEAPEARRARGQELRDALRARGADAVLAQAKRVHLGVVLERKEEGAGAWCGA